MLIIPLRAVPNQTLTTLAASQNCRINIYQKAFGIYFDLLVPALNPDPLVAGVVCRNANRLVRYAYHGFVGDFAVFDQQGQTDPTFAGLGARYQLVYLEAADLVRTAA